MALFVPVSPWQCQPACYCWRHADILDSGAHRVGFRGGVGSAVEAVPPGRPCQNPGTCPVNIEHAGAGLPAPASFKEAPVAPGRRRTVTVLVEVREG
jgi:hypothetical protein